MIGIYKITNKENGKVYIGKSVSIENRWKQHIKELDENKHHTVRLQYDYNKFGITKFVFSVLEICDEDVLSNREQFFINQYFNQCEGEIYNTQININVQSNKNKSSIKTRLNTIKCIDGLKYNISNINSGRIIMYLLSLNNSNYYEFTVSELSKIFGIVDTSIYRDYDTIVKDINNTTLNGHDIFESYYEKGVFIINMLNDIKAIDSKIAYKYICGIKCKYTFNILNDLISKKNVTYSICEFKDRVGVNNINSYNRYFNLKVKVISEILHDLSNMKINYEFVETKHSKKIEYIQIKI